MFTLSTTLFSDSFPAANLPPAPSPPTPRRLARQFLVLVAAVLVAALAFRAAEGDPSAVTLPNLALSVLVALALPVLIVCESSR